MNESADRLLVTWLEEGPDRGSPEAVERAMAATRRTTQRPGWTIPERWLPMQLAMRPAVQPAGTRRLFLIVAVALLALALAATALFIGSRQRIAPPFGPAANGSIVVGVDGHLWLADRNGRDARQLFIGQALASSPTYSPDGTRLAFKSRDVAWNPSSIWVADADGSSARSVTGEFPIVAGDLAWSADSSAIVFSSSDRGINRLYRVDLRGGPPHALTDRSGDRSSPALSPDGQWLAYQSRATSGPSRVSLMVSRPDGSAERELVFIPRGGSSYIALQWAPGSDRIAYMRSDPSGHVVATVDLEGNETQVSRPGEDAVNPSWSPDGLRLAYIGSPGTGSFVLDTANPSDRIHIPSAMTDCGIAWSPDGSFLLGIDEPCTGLYVIPIDDPEAARQIDMPEGLIDFTSWQRTAP
jgi:Tol biopolymer transport system component